MSAKKHQDIPLNDTMYQQSLSVYDSPVQRKTDIILQSPYQHRITPFNNLISPSPKKNILGFSKNSAFKSPNLKGIGLIGNNQTSKRLFDIDEGDSHKRQEDYRPNDSIFEQRQLAPAHLPDHFSQQQLFSNFQSSQYMNSPRRPSDQVGQLPKRYLLPQEQHFPQFPPKGYFKNPQYNQYNQQQLPEEFECPEQYQKNMSQFYQQQQQQQPMDEQFQQQFQYPYYPYPPQYGFNQYGHIPAPNGIPRPPRSNLKVTKKQKQKQQAQQEKLSANSETIAFLKGKTPDSALLKTPSKKTRVCNCKRTKCLKLYCDCFAIGELCGPECNCFDCCNSNQFSEIRFEAIKQILEKQPDAFSGKIQNDTKNQKQTHKKGCNCRRSGCQKKYCECYSAGVKCSEYCKCDECKNVDGNCDHSKKKKIFTPQSLLGKTTTENSTENSQQVKTEEEMGMIQQEVLQELTKDNQLSENDTLLKTPLTNKKNKQLLPDFEDKTQKTTAKKQNYNSIRFNNKEEEDNINNSSGGLDEKQSNQIDEKIIAQKKLIEQQKEQQSSSETTKQLNLIDHKIQPLQPNPPSEEQTSDTQNIQKDEEQQQQQQKLVEA